MFRAQTIINLLGKLRKGELSEVERQQLAIWRAENERNEELYTEIAKDRFVVSPILQRMLAMDTEGALMRLKQIRANREQAEKRRRLWWRSGSVAAALITVFVILFLTNKFPIHLRHAENHRLVKTDTIQIVPGSDRATLILANGEEVQLEQIDQGEVLEQEGLRLVKTAEGELRYEILEIPTAQHSTNLVHTIATPSGGQYQVLLPDGTMVWLNAASSLVYSPNFLGKERKVKLEGEAYFEVASREVNGKKLPFIIELQGQTVEVLGTKLNIQSYADEEIIRTTLVSGRIRVTSGEKSINVLPGQQVQISKYSNNMEVVRVNADDVVSWKNGYFVFDNEPIDMIMSEIGRWYNVEIAYDLPIRPIRFEGSVSKFSNIEDVLDILQMTGGCKFQIEGRRVIVMQ